MGNITFFRLHFPEYISQRIGIPIFGSLNYYLKYIYCHGGLPSMVAEKQRELLYYVDSETFI